MRRAARNVYVDALWSRAKNKRIKRSAVAIKTLNSQSVRRWMRRTSASGLGAEASVCIGSVVCSVKATQQEQFKTRLCLWRCADRPSRFRLLKWCRYSVAEFRGCPMGYYRRSGNCG